MLTGLVSIIIPAWQSASTLPTTLATVFAQTYQSIEVIVVDDASTDDTLMAIAPWRDRLRYEKLSVNAGAPHARNVGFGLSKGEYVMFCDSDLILRPDAIEKLVTTLEDHPEASYAYGSFRFGWKKFKGGVFSDEKLKEKNFIHTSALIRREAQPRFDESLKRFQDWDLWLTLLDQGKIGVWYPQVLFQAIPRGKIGISTWRPSIWYSMPWDTISYVPETVRKYRAAAEIVKKKHGIIPIQEKFDFPWLRTIEFLALLEIGSWFAHQYPSLSLPLLIAIIAGVFVASLQSLSYGLGAIALELIIGSHGHMIGLGQFGEGLSIRVAMFAAVFIAWCIHVIQERVSVPKFPLRILFVVAAVIYGIVVAFANHRSLGEIISDANSYGFLILLLPLLSWIRTSDLKKARTLIGTGVTWLALKTLVLAYVFSHFGDSVIRATYTWIRDTRVGEVTRILGPFHRVFMPSQLFLGIALVFSIAMAMNTRRSRYWYALIMLEMSALLVSLSRSILLGIALGLVSVVILEFAKNWKQALGPSLKAFSRMVLAIVGGLLIFATIAKFPYPHQSGNIDLSKLFADRYGSLGDPAVSARWALLTPLWGEIKKNPVIGYGFGKTITYESPDPFWRNAQNPTGSVTTTRFEWGWLDVWLKFGLIGGLMVLAYLWLLGNSLWKISDLTLRSAALGMFVTLLATHATTPYLDHPIGLGILLALEVLVAHSTLEKDTSRTR